MNLNQLKLFYLAVKLKSLSQAAKELHITQPAVSKGVQRLQDHYEVKLFHRLGKDTDLTEAGQELFHFAEKIFELESLAEDRIRQYQEANRGHIRIQASESFGAYYLPEFINHFNRIYPRIQVTVDILPNHKVVEGALNLQSDLGFVSYPVKDRKLHTTAILQDELVVIMRPDHRSAAKKRLEIKDLEGETMVMHEEGSIVRKIMADLVEKHRISMTMPITLSSNEAIKRAVEGGGGIALISGKVAEEEVLSGKLTALFLDDCPSHRYFYMIYHKDKFLTGPLRDFTDLLIKAFTPTG